MKKKVVLAFSGGLDTSYCAVYLNKEKKLDVYSAIVNTGGFSTEEERQMEKKAYELGVKQHVCLNVTDDYYSKCIRYMIYGNILKNNTYPLSVSSERMFQAIALAKYAKEINADYIAHGSTGAGNDQIRFDSAFQILAPNIEILTPIRNQQLSRNQEIEYLKKHDIDANWKKAAYSINKGLWGTSIGGVETLTSHSSIPEEAFTSQLQKDEVAKMELEFSQGQIIRVNGINYSNPVDAIRKIEAIASQYAIGRDIHVGDTIIGIKGRVAFEAPAPMIIIKSHHTLEKHTLTKWQQYWKEQLANWYGMLLHEAQYLDPVMRNIEKFLMDTQKFVTGKVFIKLSPYRFDILGIDSKHDLMNNDFARYGEMNTAFSGEDVQGFTRILSNQMKIHHLLHDKNE